MLTKSREPELFSESKKSRSEKEIALISAQVQLHSLFDKQ